MLMMVPLANTLFSKSSLTSTKIGTMFKEAKMLNNGNLTLTVLSLLSPVSPNHKSKAVIYAPKLDSYHRLNHKVDGMLFYKSLAVAEMGDRVTTIYIGQKLGDCAPFGRGNWFPI